MRTLVIFMVVAITTAAGAVGPPRGNSIPERLLAAQNSERARMGVAPLAWDPALAASAAQYGPALVQLGRLQHSPRESRPGQRENLWMGTAGAFSPEQMVGSWIDERRDYRAGIFPAVSRTGNYEDVAHYTQLIWPVTTRVGCALTQGGGFDYLVCRYSPPGNRDGVATP